jgi:hypothetical protein
MVKLIYLKTIINIISVKKNKKTINWNKMMNLKINKKIIKKQKKREEENPLNLKNNQYSMMTNNQAKITNKQHNNPQ